MMGGCSSKATSSKGVVCDATMNTVTIVTNKNDTLSFSTMDASKDEVNGLLLNDTLEVFYTGKYTPGMQASKLVQYPQSPIVGGDRDEHGCIGSAGYVWCEVQQDCIRLFEKGIRTEAVDCNDASAFIVFSPASSSVKASGLEKSAFFCTSSMASFACTKIGSVPCSAIRSASTKAIADFRNLFIVSFSLL